MDFLKELFNNQQLSFEDFCSAVNAKGFKLADLSTGNYVGKRKYEDELKSKDSTIEALNAQLTTRDTDISNLKKKLEDGTTDNKTKLADLSSQLDKLQGDYTQVKTEYETKLQKQAYEFAVKEFANTKNFTSNAAKRDFINEMLNKELQLEKDKILGADDFTKSYAEANQDAFVVETNETTDATEPKPKFITNTPPTTPPDDNAFINAFNFSGVRPHSNNE